MIEKSITLDGLTGTGKTATCLLLREELDYMGLDVEYFCDRLMRAIRENNINQANSEQVINFINGVQVNILKSRPRKFVQHRSSGHMHFYKIIKPGPYQLSWSFPKGDKVNAIGDESDLTSREIDNRWEEAYLDVASKRFDAAKRKWDFWANPDIHQALQRKIKQIAEQQPIILEGNYICASSLLLAANFKFVLRASITVRNQRLTNEAREYTGGIIDKSEEMPFTLAKDEYYLSRPKQLDIGSGVITIGTDYKTVYETAEIIKQMIKAM